MFQIIERLGIGKFLARHKILAHIYTIMICIFGWVLFRSDDLMEAGVMVRRMLIPWEYTESPLIIGKVFGNKTLVVIFAGILGCGFIQCILNKSHISEKLKDSYLEMAFCGILFVYCVAALASGTYNPFIYFRF